MKRRHYFLTGLASIQIGVLAAACSIPDVCEEFDVCSGSSGAGGTGGSSSSGMSTSSTGIDPTCDPNDAEAYAPTAECGVFVSATAAGGDGTPAKPFADLSDAVTKANAEGKPLYLCGTGYVGEFTLEAGVGIFGGLTCDGWKPSSDKSKITGVADKPVLRVMSTTAVAVEGVEVVAAPALAFGGSSIAVIVGESAVVAIKNSSLTASNGKEGEDGTTPTMNFAIGPVDGGAQIDHGLDGETGKPSDTTNLNVALTGGAAAGHPQFIETNCKSVGGAGGAGGPFVASPQNASPGSDGTPPPLATCPVAGCGGPGATSGACAPGEDGSDGTPGMHGNGASDVGSVSSTGFVGSSGEVGAEGQAGQGAGGGGGAKGATGPNSRGASGGAGGIGGCGGLGATPGQGGGSSIGVIALGTVTFEQVEINVGAGGNGGDGMPGQGGFFGGDRGPRGTGPTNACFGGVGGKGGPGGASGGGRGGHAVYVMFVETAPTGFTPGAKGSPGEPGATPSGTAALAGAGSDTLQVPLMQ